jgi:hypothetical protein
MNVNTGFGYYTDSNGHIVAKYVLPIGEHPNPVGMTVTEVANQAALDAVVLYVAPISPVDAFSVDQFKGDLLGAFDSDANIYLYYALVVDLASFKNFSTMKQMILAWQTAGKITTDEINLFIGVLANQNIVWADL